MKNTLIILLGTVLLILLVVLFVLMQIRNATNPPTQPIPTTLPLPSMVQVTTAVSPTPYPEYQLPTPESLAPTEDLNAYEKLPKSEQEYSLLVLETPIKTANYSLTFDFANSVFIVEILNEKGMEEYLALRNKYASLKDNLFVLSDKR